MKTLRTILKIFQIILWVIVFAFVTWFVVSYIWVLCTNISNPSYPFLDNSELELPSWNFFRIATSH